MATYLCEQQNKKKKLRAHCLANVGACRSICIYIAYTCKCAQVYWSLRRQAMPTIVFR